MNAYQIVLLLTVVGLGILLWGIFVILLGLAAQRWPSTTGRILESGFRDYNEPGNYGYTYHVKYQYSVQGRVRTATRLRFGLGSYMDKTTADSFVARYQVGREVTVFYHPKHSLSVLERGFTSPTYFLLMLGGFIVIVGLWMLTESNLQGAR